MNLQLEHEVQGISGFYDKFVLNFPRQINMQKVDLWQENKKIPMKDFKNYYLVQAPPEDVYLALTNPLTLSLWTGTEASMSTEPGSEFSLWDDSISGRNIEFVENRKIVQQWYFGDQPEDSIVTFLLHPDKNGTSVELRHTNIPDSDFEDMIEGWNLNYFGSLQDFYEE